MTDKTETKSDSTELAVRSSTDIAAVEDLRKLLMSGAWEDFEGEGEVIDDPEAVQREIMAELLYAESDDEVLNQTPAIGLRELARRYVSHHGLPPSDGVALELHGFKWRRSDIEGQGLPIYFIISATRLDTGERIVTTTGASTVIAQVANLAIRRTLDGAKVLCTETEKATRGGYYPMALVRTPRVTASPAPSASAAQAAAAA